MLTPYQQQALREIREANVPKLFGIAEKVQQALTRTGNGYVETPIEGNGAKR